MTYEIVKTVPAHIRDLATRLRAGDCREIESAGLNPRQALWRSYKASLVARSAILDDQVICIWGCAGQALSGMGEPWLLTSGLVERYPISFVKEARREVMTMLSIFPKLQGNVLASYNKACAFLVITGFTLSEPFPFGPNRVPFRRYTLERR